MTAAERTAFVAILDAAGVHTRRDAVVEAVETIEQIAYLRGRRDQAIAQAERAVSDAASLTQVQP